MLSKWKKNMPYKGSLANPIRVDPVPELLAKYVVVKDDIIEARDRENFQKWYEANLKQVGWAKMVKMLTLARHHDVKIEPGDEFLANFLFALCNALADEHVPGFKVVEKKPRGRRNKWDLHGPILLAEVRSTIESRAAKTGRRSARDACRMLARRPPWAELTNRNHDSLYQRYQEAKANPTNRAAVEIMDRLDAHGIDRMAGLHVLIRMGAEKSHTE